MKPLGQKVVGSRYSISSFTFIANVSVRKYYDEIQNTKTNKTYNNILLKQQVA